MIDREKVIKALENGISTAEAIEGEFVYITKGEARMALELLKREHPRCKDCLHYHNGVHYEDGTKIPDNVGYCEVHERRFFGKIDYCSYHTGV